MPGGFFSRKRGAFFNRKRGIGYGGGGVEWVDWEIVVLLTGLGVIEGARRRTTYGRYLRRGGVVGVAKLWNWCRMC